MGEFSLAINAFAEKAGEHADIVVRKVVLEIWSRLIVRSPVRTGRFRGNWLYAFGAPPIGEVETSGVPGAPAGPPALPAIHTAVGVHWIGNNLPYGLSLERGSSKQAPLGMVGITVAEFRPIVDDAAQGLDSFSVLGSER